MNDCEAKIREYYDLKPTQFSVIHSLTISQDIGASGVCEQRVSVVLGKNLSDKSQRLYVDFDGVRNLQIQQPDWSQISIGHIEIMPVGDVPNVDGKYLVRDPEQERIIWFGCRDFQAVVG